MLKSGFSVSTRCVVLVAFAAVAAIGAPAVASAEGPATLHIAFVGDSMADGLWGAMFRRLGKDKCLADKVKLIRRAENGTGLTRLDQYSWVDEVGRSPRIRGLTFLLARSASTIASRSSTSTRSGPNLAARITTAATRESSRMCCGPPCRTALPSW